MSGRSCNLVHIVILHERLTLTRYCSWEAYSALVVTNVISGVSSPGIELVISTLCQHRPHTRDVADTQGLMEARTRRHHLPKIWGVCRTPQPGASRMLLVLGSIV